MKLKLFSLEDFINQATSPVAIATRVKTKVVDNEFFSGKLFIQHYYVVLTSRWKKDLKVVVVYEEHIGGPAEMHIEEKIKEKVKELEEKLITKFEVLDGTFFP